MCYTETCDACRVTIEASFPRVMSEDGKECLCIDCALKQGKLPPKEWLDLRGLGIYEKATYEDGVIYAFQKWGRGYRKDEIRLVE